MSQLLFAEGSLLFLRANKEGAEGIKRSRRSYCDASWQRVDFSKSSMHFTNGYREEVCKKMKFILEVKQEALSDLYFGVSMGWAINKLALLSSQR